MSDCELHPDRNRMMGGNNMKKTVRILSLVLCLAAALFVLSSCGGKSDQSKSPLIGTWIAQEEGNSDITFNADGTGCLQREDRIENFTFTDKGNGSYEMSAEHSKTKITQGYRIEGDTLYTINMELGIEEAYTRKQ